MDKCEGGEQLKALAPIELSLNVGVDRGAAEEEQRREMRCRDGKVLTGTGSQVMQGFKR